MSSRGDWVDFKAIREHVPIERVLAFLGVDNLKRQGDDRLVGPCPIHKGDSPRAFNVTPSKNAWFCFSQCGRGGNQLDLVMAMRDCSVREAGLLLKPLLTDQASTPAAPSARSNASARPEPTPFGDVPSDAHNPVIDVELNLATDYPYLTDRGLSEDTIATFGVGYCNRGIMRGTIAIPIHNTEGGLVAYAGRRLKPQEVREYGKYKLPKGFRKELELYNWHRARESIAASGVVVLVEGFFSVMHLHQRGLPNVVAAMGSGISEVQAELLAQVPDVVVMFDGDEAGHRGAERARAQLRERTFVSTVHLPEDLEPEDLSRAALDWLIAGARVFAFEHIAVSMRGLEPVDTD